MEEVAAKQVKKSIVHMTLRRGYSWRLPIDRLREGLRALSQHLEGRGLLSRDSRLRKIPTLKCDT